MIELKYNDENPHTSNKKIVFTLPDDINVFELRDELICFLLAIGYQEDCVYEAFSITERS